MISAIALVTGASAVFVGSLLLRTWLRHGGASGTSHFRRIQILGHAAVGILGVVLVVVQLAAGDLERAIPLHQQTLREQERVLGPDHANTLASRNNLAGAHLFAGDLGRAIPLHQQILTDSERVHGRDHPNTLGSRNNLAFAYYLAGDLAQAIPLFQQTFTDCERVLGPDHPTR